MPHMVQKNLIKNIQAYMPYMVQNKYNGSSC